MPCANEADSAPLSHPHGSGGVQRGRTVGSSPLVHSFGTFLLHNRKVHFSTVGGLHGVSPPRPKNLFFKNRFPPTFGEYTSPPSVAFTACARQGQRTYFPKTHSADVRRVHFSTVGGLLEVSLPRLKNSFFKNRFPPSIPASTNQRCRNSPAKNSPRRSSPAGTAKSIYSDKP